MTAAAGNTPAAVVIDKNVNVDVSVKESLVNEKAKDTTGKGFSIKSILTYAFVAIAAVGLVIAGYVANQKFDFVAKFGAAIAANPMLAAGILAGAALVVAAGVGLYLVFKPETSEAKLAKTAKLETAAETASKELTAAKDVTANAKTALEDAEKEVTGFQGERKPDNTDWVATEKKVAEAKVRHTDATNAEKLAETKHTNATSALDAAKPKVEVKVEEKKA